MGDRATDYIKKKNKYRLGKKNNNTSRLDWNINSRHITSSQQITQQQPVGLGYEPRLSQLCPVGLGHRHELQ
jgi:hypothetical protein